MTRPHQLDITNLVNQDYLFDLIGEFVSNADYHESDHDYMVYHELQILSGITMIKSGIPMTCQIANMKKQSRSTAPTKGLPSLVLE